MKIKCLLQNNCLSIGLPAIIVIMFLTTMTSLAQDTVPPTFVPPIPMDTTVSCDNVPSPANVTATDTCEPVSIEFTQTRTDGSCPGDYSLRRVWVASDDCGNEDSVVQIVTVIDTTAPEIINASQDTTVSCDAPVPAFNVMTSENCSGTLTSYSESVDNNTTCPVTRTITRTFVASDLCGNSDTVMQIVTIIDTTPPAFDQPAPADTVISCSSDVPPPANLTASDNCQGETVTFSEDTTFGSCPSNFELRRVWTATDDCANEDSVVQIISVMDTTPPLFDQVAPSDTTVNCDELFPMDTLTATDNCGSATVTMEEEVMPGGCTGENTLRRVWRAEDDCGNIDSVEQFIMVIDTIAPTFDSPAPADTTVSCESVPAMAVLTATDNCDAPTVSTQEDTIPGTCPQDYTLQRMWIASDACGNADTVQQTVTVIDTTAPVFDTNPMDTVVNCDAAIPNPSPTATDNCGDVTMTAISAIALGTCPTVYEISRSWTAEDECGNSATVSQQVTVQDTTPPTITCPADTTIACTTTADTMNTGMANANDGCSMPTITYSDDTTAGPCAGNYTIARTFVAEDSCGNADSCTQIITVVDTVAPIFNEPVPTDTTIACDAAVPPAATLTSTDNCGTDTVVYFADTTAGTCPQEYTISRTWIASDDCGNSRVGSQIINVVDTVAPVFDSPAAGDTTVNCDAVPAMDTLTATDNCGMVTVVIQEDTIAGLCPQEYTLQRMWIASDECGNTDTMQQMVSVIDTVAPVFDNPAPADTTVECDAVPPMATLTATDNCGLVTITTSEDTTAGLCPQEYTLNRIWTAEDECGNIDSVLQTVMVIDTTAPVFDINPADTTVDCDAVLPDPSPMATDNCGAVTMTAASSITQGACPNEFIISRSWTATDECGNSATVSQTVFIQDTTAPAITCPADITIECTTTADTSLTGMATATDNCDSMVTITYSDDTTAGNCAGNYTIARTFVAEDTCGNVDSCTQTISVIDTLSPVFNEPEPSDTTILCEAIVPAPASITATDNCSLSGVTYRADTTAGACPQEFTIRRVWTAVDSCGNVDSMDQVIMIIDTVAPVFDALPPADMTVSCDAVPAIDSTLGAFDFCGDVIETFRQDTTAQSCSSAYDLRRVWTAADSCGNIDSVVQLITVIDTTPPVFDNIAPNDTTVSCDAVPAAVTLTATDNCDTAIVTFSEDTTAGICPQEYTLLRTWIASDDCGNMDTLEQTVNVIDTTPPVFDINPMDTVVDCDAAVPSPSPIATDNCGDVAMTASSSIMQGSCPNEFIINRTWTATDECGNSSSVNQTVTIQDTTAPVITCPADVTIECTTEADTSVTGMATATDNCETDVNITFSDDTIPGTCAGNYVIERTFVADDSCGNLDSCTQTITVIDTVAPEFTQAPPPDTTIACDASIPTPVAMGAVDSCSMMTLSFREDSIPGSCPQEYTLRRVWTASDECGNVDSVDRLIMIIDTVAPVFDNLPQADTTIDCNQPISIAENLTATDNCGTATVTLFENFVSGSCPQESTTTRIWIAEDGCGNSDTVTRVITVQDTFAPVFDSLPSDTIVDCDATVPPAEMLTATDTCGTATITFTEDTTSGTCPNEYTLLRTWVAEDECGNSDTVSQTVMIQDTTPPAISCPADITIECTQEADTSITGIAVATDNCDTNTISITYSDDTTAGICAGDYSIARTFVASDTCGNIDSCVQTITVIDTVPPTIVNVTPSADTTIACDSPFPLFGFGAEEECSVLDSVAIHQDTIPGACPQEYTIRLVFVAGDDCGNIDSVIRMVNVIDTVAPIFDNTPPADTTIACDAAVPAPAMLTATDNCDTAFVTFSADTTVGVCAQEFSIRRVWTASDSCGNSDSVEQMIMIIDTVAPVFDNMPAADTTVSCDEAVPAPTMLTATDNCGTATVTLSADTTQGACPQEYTIQRVWTAMDECGNADSVARTIMVIDTTSPLITCPADIAISCDMPADTSATGTATAIDNCGEVEITFIDSLVDNPCLDTIYRIWTAVDSCGNSSECVQSISLLDTVGPSITCLGPDTISCEGPVARILYAPSQNDDPQFRMDISNATGATVDYFDARSGTPTVSQLEEYGAVIVWADFSFANNTQYGDNLADYVDAGGVVILGQFNTYTTGNYLDGRIMDPGYSPVVSPTGSANFTNQTYNGDGVLAVFNGVNNLQTGITDQLITQGPGKADGTYSTTGELVFAYRPDYRVTYINGFTGYTYSAPGDWEILIDNILDEAIFAEITDNCSGIQSISYSDDTTAGACAGNYTVQRTYVATDSCSNVDSCTYTFVVIDTVAPVFDTVPPADTTIACDAIVPSPVTLSATDNCSAVSIDFNEDTTDMTCPSEYTIRRVWTAMDSCGNTDSVTRNIFIVDTVAPQIMTTSGDTTIACDATVPDFNITVFENCSSTDQDFTEEIIDGACDGEQIIFRKYVVNDQCGNADSVTQTITVIDTTAPVFDIDGESFADTISVSCIDSLPSMPMVSAMDNCSDAEITFTEDTLVFNCESDYEMRRRWVATDSCGNADTLDQTIFVYDVQGPTFVDAPADTLINCGAAIPDPQSLAVTDSCTGATYLGYNDYDTITPWHFTQTSNSGSGVQGDTLMLMGPDGNSGDSQTVAFMAVAKAMTISFTWEYTTFDSDGPSFDRFGYMVNGVKTQLSDNNGLDMQTGTDSVQLSAGDEFAFYLAAIDDAFGEAEVDIYDIVYDLDTMTCPIVDCFIRRFEAEDDCGNPGYAYQLFTVQDTSAPVFSQNPADTTVECDAVPFAPMVTATDSCEGMVPVSFVETQFDSVCEGTYKLRRVWTATDSCNNSDSVVQVITVIDTVPPAITLFTPDTVVSCDSLVPGFSAVALDNCSGENTSFNEEVYEGNCPVIDSIVRTYIATDGCGNADTITQTILTIDTVAPQFDSPLPPDTTIACDAVIPPSPILSTSDNCSGVDSISETLDTIPGICESNFTIIRAWTVVDSCGNSNVDSQTITVVDTVPPSLVGKPDADTIFIYDGDCSNGPDAISIMADTITPIAMGENVDTFMVFGTGQITPNDTLADNCSSTDSLELYAWNMSFDSTACTSTVTINYRLYDDCGNYDSLVRSYHFIDTIPPSITWDGADTVEIECASDMPVFPTVTAVDSCDFTLDTMVVATDSVCVNQKTVMRSVVATDECGLSDTVSQVIYITDTIAPMFTAMDETVMVECAFEEPPYLSTDATDNCGVASIDTTVTVTDSNCVNQYTKVREFIAMDSCGNADTLTQTIVVNDTEPPVITNVPPDITIECDDDVPSDVPSATDNCDTVFVTFTDQITPGACPQEQTIVRTFTVSDECGNSATAQRTIEVVDTTVPFLINAPDDMTLNCDETPPFTPPVVEDNCDPNPEITFEDTYHADPNCPQGGRIDRVFTISDACGNSYVLLQQFEFIDTTAPVIEPVHPDLVGLPNGGTLEYQCFAQDSNWELEKFEIADFEITDNCSEDIQVTLEETVVSQGDCLNDGYLARTEYTITADDQCGNVTTYNFFVEVVDNIAPELFGVPSDVTISCEEDYDYPVVGNCEHAEVYAEDECECGNVEEIRDTIPGSCPNEYSVLVTYIATDNCGNATTGFYTITVVDENSPVLLPRLSQLTGVPSGSEVEVDCQNGDFPSWVHNIGPNSLMAIDNCGSSELTDYTMNTHGYNDCFDAGALGYNDYSWTYEDECGNVSTYSLRILLVDHTPPVIVLDNEVICEGDSIETPQVTDNCGDAQSLTYEEYEVIDECSGEEIVERVWTARDYCGNIATATQKIVDPVDLEFDFAVDILAGVMNGDTVSLECSEVAELTPSEEWITLSGGCFGEGEVLELSVDNGQMDSTCANGVIRLDTWTWLVEDICGNVEEIVVYVEVRDELAPVIPDFESQITMICGDERPMYEVVDACGSPSTIEETSFELISGDTCTGRVFERIILTSDACGNEREYTQTVIIDGDMGPEILGIPGEAVCDESELANVSAFDHCAGMEVPVRFEDITDEECGNGERTLRVYSATSMCGTETRDSVYIVSGDDTEASYQVVGDALRGLRDGSIVEIECDRDTSLRDIEINASDVIFIDDCDPDPEVTFTDRVAFGNCRVDGYLRTRILTWESRDACGNVSRVRIEFRLVDTQAPQFYVVPDDVTILCDDEYEFEEAIAVDACHPGVEVTYEDSDPQMVPEGTLIVRTWTADDGCGNVSTVDQRIVYDNGDLACSIEGPVIVNCAEDDVRLSASVKGGLGPYNYEWLVTGGVCEITQGQGTSNVLVDVGFSNAQITLLVEDQLGCITTCQIDLICDLDTRFEILRERDKREYNLYQNIPNPFDGVTTIGFSLPEDAAAVLKVYDASGKQVSEIKGNYEAGYNEVELRRTDIPAAGVFYYELTSGDFQGVKRMVLIE